MENRRKATTVSVLTWKRIVCRLNSHHFPSRRKRGITTFGLRSAAKKILAMCRFTVINAKVVFEVEFEGEMGEGVISGEKSSKTVEQLQVAPCLSASLASCLRLRVATSRYPPPCRPSCCPLCTVQAPRAVPVYPPGCHCYPAAGSPVLGPS